MQTGFLLLRRSRSLRVCHRSPLSSFLKSIKPQGCSYTAPRSMQYEEMETRDDVSTSSTSSDALKACAEDYVLIEDVERIHYYKPGGYHPVRLGDRLHDRYRIVEKLGFGAYSTIWLAEDERSMTWVAVKICVAMLRKPAETGLSRLLHDLDRVKKHPGQEAIRPTLDEFTVQGPNGTHHCFVMAPARTSIAISREASYNRQVANLPAGMTASLLTFADLHEGNILFRLSDSIFNLTIEQIYEKYGEPEVEPVQRQDKQPLSANVPTHVVVPTWLGGKSDSITLAESGIFLSDFGESFQPATTERCYSHTPHTLRPPELYFEPDTSLSYPSDVWALACTIFSIQGQQSLFETWFASDKRMPQEYVELLGPLPSKWWTRWTERHNVFDENMNKKNGDPVIALEDHFENVIQKARRQDSMPEMDEDERRAFLTLMRSMLAFKPEDRPTAEEVLQSDWMVNWAMKDLERARRLFSHSK